MLMLSEVKRVRIMAQPQSIVEDEAEVKVCDICGDAGYGDQLSICSVCNEGAEHIYCMETRLETLPMYWICMECQAKKKKKKKEEESSDKNATTVDMIACVKDSHIGSSLTKGAINASDIKPSCPKVEKVLIINVDNDSMGVSLSQDVRSELSGLLDNPMSGPNNDTLETDLFSSLKILRNKSAIGSSASRPIPSQVDDKEMPFLLPSRTQNLAEKNLISTKKDENLFHIKIKENIQVFRDNEGVNARKNSQSRDDSDMGRISEAFDCLRKCSTNEKITSIRCNTCCRMGRALENCSFTSDGTQASFSKHLLAKESNDKNQRRGFECGKVPMRQERFNTDGSDETKISSGKLCTDFGNNMFHNKYSLDKETVDMSYGNSVSDIGAIPRIQVLWSGSFIVNFNSTFRKSCKGLQAYPSNRANPKVYEVMKRLPNVLELEELQRGAETNSWPNSFEKFPPSSNNIGVYFFPINIRSHDLWYTPLLDRMSSKDLALRKELDVAQLVVYPSVLLPKSEQSWNDRHFLWGIFRTHKVVRE